MSLYHSLLTYFIQPHLADEESYFVSARELNKKIDMLAAHCRSHPQDMEAQDAYFMAISELSYQTA